MILSILVILLAGGIAYFHVVQGLFTATVSAICAAFAVLIAFGYYENVAERLLGGVAADYAHALVLVGLFAGSYIILRVIFDLAVPGNIRAPLYLEKGGAAVMGLVAGVMAMGVWATAAQLLPFGPSIGGVTRFELVTREGVALPRSGRQAGNFDVRDEMADDVFDPAKAAGLWVPVDSMLINFVSKQSSRGALAGARSFESVHPDFQTEMFGQRLGIQVGARRVASGTGGTNPVRVTGIYRLQSVSQIQGEMTEIKDRKLASKIDLSPNEMFVIVRVAVDDSAADATDRKFRFSLGSIRLVANGQQAYPVGTLEDGGVLFSSKMDDFLVKQAGKSFDVVFRLPTNDPPDTSLFSADKTRLADGAFIEIKRMGRAELSAPIGGRPTIEDAVGLQWKPPVLAKKPGAPLPAGDDSPLEDIKAALSEVLFTPINVGSGERNATGVTFNGGSASIRERTLSSFNFDGSRSITVMSQGDAKISQLATPDGTRLVQITAGPRGDDLWKWSDLSKFELTDSSGAKHKPLGAWAKVAVGTSTHLVGKYDFSRGVSDVDKVDGDPTEVTLLFAVKPGVTLQTLRFAGKPVGGRLSLQVQ